MCSLGIYRSSLPPCRIWSALNPLELTCDTAQLYAQFRFDGIINYHYQIRGFIYCSETFNRLFLRL